MKYLKITGAILISILFIFALAGLPSAAASEYPFIVEPVYPDEQVEPNNGYFYINTTRGKLHKLSVKIKNTSTAELRVGVESASCYTSTGGDLVYITRNESPLVGLTDALFVLEEKIYLPSDNMLLKPGESRIFTFSVEAPGLDAGEVLGAIRFFVVTKAQENVNQDRSLNLDVKNAITIAIRLRYPEPANALSPGITVGDAGFMPEMGIMYITLRNELPVINRKADGRLFLYDEKGAFITDKSFDLIKMAPKSEVRLPIYLSRQKIESGKLFIDVSLSGTEIRIRRELQLTPDDVEIIDEATPPAAAPEAPQIAAENKPLIYGGWIMFALTAIFFILFVLLRRRKGREDH